MVAPARTALISVGILGLVGLLFLVTPTAQQSVANDLHLDLSPFFEMAPVDDLDTRTPAVRERPSHSGEPRKQIEVTLVTIEPRDVAWNDLLVYNVRVKNVGEQTLTLPWSADVYLFGPDPHRGSISLDVLTADAKNVLTTVTPIQSLAGTEFQAGTLKPLRPGQGATFRVMTRWQTIDADAPARLKAQPAGTLRIRASVYLHTEGLWGYSANSVNINDSQAR